MNRDAIPVTVLTGYLGSGKTTLLQRLLEGPAGNRTAVLINEFGEISLDHLMVHSVEGSTVVLQNGCICCTVRAELQSGLRELLTARSKGLVPDFDRILVETTGLADPVPIVQTLVADPMLRHQVRLAHLVATVDALNGAEQLDGQEEALRQAATADRLIVTKTDLVDGERLGRLRDILLGINPTARTVQMPGAPDLTELLFGEDGAAGSDGPAEMARWLRRLERAPASGRAAEAQIQAQAQAQAQAQGRVAPHPPHGATVHTFVLRPERRMEWTAFAVWLSLMVHRHGRRILRVKGLLDVPQARGPILLNAVQHFIHPPVHLDGWPDDDRSSRLVFIVQDLEEEAIRRSLDNFLARAEALMDGETVGQ